MVFRGLRVERSGPVLRERVDDECRVVAERFADPGAVRDHPSIEAFRAIHRRVGAEPDRWAPSVQSLYRSVLQRGTLPAINNLVDAYNLVSLRTLVSLGAHDLDRIESPVTLRLLTGEESFTPLGAGEPRPVRAGDFGYVDAANRLLCRLDVVQADFSKVTADTTNAMLIIEATDTHGSEQIEAAFEESIALVQEHCGGRAEIIADA